MTFRPSDHGDAEQADALAASIPVLPAENLAEAHWEPYLSIE